MRQDRIAHSGKMFAVLTMVVLVTAGAGDASAGTAGASDAGASDASDASAETRLPPRAISRQTGPFVQAEVHLSVFSDAAERSILGGAFGYGLKGGYRYKGWSFFMQVEHDVWIGTELDAKVTMGAVNVGFGVELLYARGFVRSSFALGPSILTYDTALDRRGTTGLFMDIRPVGLRFKVSRHFVIGLDPLSFTMVAPVLSGIPLINIQYRTVITVEANW